MSDATDTLKIKHLPKELSELQKENFVRHFGATRVKVLTSHVKEKAVVYAKFENPEIAKNVMQRIHQIKILNSRLCVEYAENNMLQEKPLLKLVSSTDQPGSKFFKSFINKINAFNENVGFNQPPPSHLKYNYPNANRATINNIAHALATIPRFYTQVLHLMNKMNLPPPFAMPAEEQIDKVTPSVSPQAITITLPAQQPPQLHNLLPNHQPTTSKPLTASAQNNVHIISQHIISTQKPVATQQLATPQQHSIPVTQNNTVVQQVVLPQIPEPGQLPRDIHEEIQQLGQVDVVPMLAQQAVQVKVGEKRRKSSSESEIESDEEAKKFKEIIPEKRPKLDKKVVNRPKFIPPPIQPAHSKKEEGKLEPKTATKSLEKIEEVFEKVEVQVPSKKIELKVTTESLEEPQEPPPENQPEVTIVATIEPHDDDDNDDDDDGDDAHPCITLEELKSNQITDFKNLPLFKNYNPGEPTNKVYIKNCSKTVTPEDLEYIYNRYREEGTEDKPSEFNIRHMKEGRMKGQAFVTLDSVEMAEKAVKETHGFILKDKPLWVAFGKAGTKKK